MLAQFSLNGDLHLRFFLVETAGGQWYNYTSPFSIPSFYLNWITVLVAQDGQGKHDDK